jgi:hypothetical protein
LTLLHQISVSHLPYDTRTARSEAVANPPRSNSANGVDRALMMSRKSDATFLANARIAVLSEVVGEADSKFRIMAASGDLGPRAAVAPVYGGMPPVAHSDHPRGPRSPQIARSNPPKSDRSEPPQGLRRREELEGMPFAGVVFMPDARSEDRRVSRTGKE